MGTREWRKSIVRFWRTNFQIMSDTKVLRLVKKTEGELPEKACTGRAVAAPEPRRTRDAKPAPVTAIRAVPRRVGAKPNQPETRLSGDDSVKICRTRHTS